VSWILAGTFFMFFSLGGDIGVANLDVRRTNLLDPSFQLNYFSIAGIAGLVFLQLLLPTLLVVAWTSYGLRTDRGTWLQTNLLLSLFWWIQVVSLVVHLHYATDAFNATHKTLSQFLAIFSLYLVSYVAAVISECLISPRSESAAAVVEGAGDRIGRVSPSAAT
jgi:hypothetical protein